MLNILLSFLLSIFCCYSFTVVNSLTHKGTEPVIKGICTKTKIKRVIFALCSLPELKNTLVTKLDEKCISVVH